MIADAILSKPMPAKRSLAPRSVEDYLFRNNDRMSSPLTCDAVNYSLRNKR